MSEIGIELLKDLATDVVKVIEKVKVANEDGNISKVEIVGMLPATFELAKDFIKAPKLLEQAKDITTLEGKELVNHIITLGVISDKAQIVAINVIEIIEKELDVYKSNIKPIIEVLG